MDEEAAVELLKQASKEKLRDGYLHCIVNQIFNGCKSGKNGFCKKTQ